MQDEEELLEFIKKVVVVKGNLTVKRIKFREITENKNEQINGYSLRLKTDANHCEFNVCCSC